MGLLLRGSFVHPQQDEFWDGVLNVNGDDVKTNVSTSHLQQNNATHFQVSLVVSNAHGIRHADRTRRKRRTKVGRAVGRGRMPRMRTRTTAMLLVASSSPNLPPIQSPIRGFKLCLAADIMIKLHHPRRTVGSKRALKI